MDTLPPRYALKARWLFPADQPPIPHGIAVISGSRIEAVGPDPCGAELFDLGQAALIPGLVNAHTHLEFSDLTKPLGARGERISAWIQNVLDYRADPERPPQKDRIVRGCCELVRHGTTTVGEIATIDWDFPIDELPPLEVVAFRELICLDSEDVADAVELGRRHLQIGAEKPGWLPGISPHAPYSVHPEVLDRCITWSRRRKIPLAMHLAESPEEMQWMRSRRGPLAELLESRGSQLRHGGLRPMDYLHGLRSAYRALIVHGNYLSEDELAFLASHADNMSVIYCPRTHAYFGHDRYPLEDMLGRGISVALGTDGRGSNPDLSLLAEMRFVANNFPEVSQATILQLGTVAGALALGRQDQFGSITCGKLANLAVIEIPDYAADDPHALLFHSDHAVQGTIYHGQWSFRAS